MELSGISIDYKKEVRRYISNNLEYLDPCIEKSKSLVYFKQLKDEYSIASYKKEIYQILKYLTYLGVEWAGTIKLPSDPVYSPKRFD